MKFKYKCSMLNVQYSMFKEKPEFIILSLSPDPIYFKKISVMEIKKYDLEN